MSKWSRNSRAFKNWTAFCLFADDSDNNSFSKSSLPEETSITVSLERRVGMTLSTEETMMKKWILSPGSSSVFKSALDDSILKEKTSITKTFPCPEKDFVAAQLVRLWLSFIPKSPNRLNEKSG